MRVVWTVVRVPNRNVNKQLDYLKISLEAWRKNSKEDTLVLYTNENTKDLLDIQGIPLLVDEINILNYSTFSKIDPSIFWASDKIRTLYQEHENSFIHLDNDFIVKCNLCDYLKRERVCFNFREDSGILYPNSTDPNIRNLSFEGRLKEMSVNTSFIYFPDYRIANNFANLSLSVMDKLSQLNIKKATYMIFAEQMLFANFLEWNKLNWECLSKDTYKAFENVWKTNTVPEGIFSFEERDSKYFHFGPKK